MKQEKTIGLVLSGGGMRGAAHVGMLKALDEAAINIHAISGSSVGAMVGALCAAGYDAKQLLEFFHINSNIFRLKHFARNLPGFLNADKYHEIFDPWLSGQTFESLNKKLYICVTDVLHAKFHFFSEGELVKPILASAAVPGIFTPVEIGDSWFIDGGTMNNFPVEPLIGQCDLLIGSMVSPMKKISKEQLSNSLRVINRASELSMYATCLPKFGSCDMMLAPEELYPYSMFDRKNINKMFEIGYENTCRNMDILYALLGDSRNDDFGRGLRVAS